MHPYGYQPLNYDTYPSLYPSGVGWPGQHDGLSSAFLSPQPWKSDPFTPSHLINRRGFSSGVPLSSNYPPFNEIAPQGQNRSTRDPDPAILWSRGESSPCFRHDHRIVIRSSDPPFSAGSWEIDHRHLIEVQFDQFGVASHCRSTWGRMGPWRPDHYRFSVEEAYLKLRMEIMMLMSRLGLHLDDQPPQAPQDFGSQFPTYTNRYGYGHPYYDRRCVRSLIPPNCFCLRILTLPSPYFRSNPWDNHMRHSQNYP